MVCSVGHKGKFGHEFLEFEFRADGKLRYANNSNYKNDTLIRKEGNLFFPFFFFSSTRCKGYHERMYWKSFEKFDLAIVYVNKAVLDEARKIIDEAEITKEDDKNWPLPDRVGRQELEIITGNEHISFTVTYSFLLAFQRTKILRTKL